MAFFPIDRNANAANNVLELKAVLVRGLAIAEQLQKESGEMTEAQMQAQYGITATSIQWNAILDAVVVDLQSTDINTYISSLG